MQVIAFIALSLVAVISALVVVTHRNPVISAMALAFNLVAISGFYFLLNAEFLGLLQIIVYAGAILVLIVFVIMLLNLPDEMQEKPSGLLQRAIGTLLAVMFVAILAKTFLRIPGSLPPKVANFGSVESVGKALYGQYFYPFEVVSLLLVVAMIGAVLLAKRKV